jgi:hypothetical protein
MGLALLVALCAAGCGNSGGSADSYAGGSSRAASAGATPDQTAQPTDGPSGAWTSSTVRTTRPDGSTRLCVQLTNRGSVATTCLSLPGVSSWIVGGEHFVLARGADIAFTDGSRIRADQDGIALGPIGTRDIADEVRIDGCDRRELVVGIAGHFGPTSPAWLPVGCGWLRIGCKIGCPSGQVAVVEFNEPSSGIALLKRDDAWAVLGVVPVNVGCSRLAGELRDACRALSLKD